MNTTTQTVSEVLAPRCGACEHGVAHEEIDEGKFESSTCRACDGHGVAVCECEAPATVWRKFPGSDELEPICDGCIASRADEEGVRYGARGTVVRTDRYGNATTQAVILAQWID